MKPAFSIVVPTLNEERFLGTLLTSLSLQTDPDFEVIIADGESEDKTVTIARKFEKKLPSLRIVTLKKRGVSYQRNAGSLVARGSFIISTDADSVFMPYTLSRLKAYSKTNPSPHFTSWFSTESDDPNDALLILLLNAGVELSVKMKRPSAYGAFMVTKRDLFETIGGYDETLEFGEDSDLCKRIYEKKGEMMGIIREGLVTYCLRRFHNQGVAKTFQLYARASFVLMLTKKSPTKLTGYNMGGHAYSEKEQKERNSLINKYEKTLKSFIDELMK